MAVVEAGLAWPSGGGGDRERRANKHSGCGLSAAGLWPHRDDKQKSSFRMYLHRCYAVDVLQVYVDACFVLRQARCKLRAVRVDGSCLFVASYPSPAAPWYMLVCWVECPELRGGFFEDMSVWQCQSRVELYNKL